MNLTWSQWFLLTLFAFKVTANRRRIYTLRQLQLRWKEKEFWIIALLPRSPLTRPEKKENCGEGSHKFNTCYACKDPHALKTILVEKCGGKAIDRRIWNHSIFHNLHYKHVFYGESKACNSVWMCMVVVMTVANGR